MKICPRCQRTYSDDDFNFCLQDGERLVVMSQPQTRYGDDSPPTVVLDQSRVTHHASWPVSRTGSVPAQWQPQPQMAAQYNLVKEPDQTLATISLCFGIASITVGWCCSSGVLFAPAALVTGFLALSKLKKDPSRFGGRGMAIGGIVAAVVYFSLLLLIIVIYGLAIIGGGLSSLN